MNSSSTIQENTQKNLIIKKQAVKTIIGLLLPTVSVDGSNNFVQGVFDNAFGTELEKFRNDFANVRFGHDRLD